MLAAQTNRPPEIGMRTPESSIHALRSPANRSQQMVNATASTSSPLPSSSPSPSHANLTPSGASVPRFHTTTRKTLDLRNTCSPRLPELDFLAAPVQRIGHQHSQPGQSSTSSSSSSSKPAFEAEDYSSFFDGFAAPQSSSLAQTHLEDEDNTNEFGFASLPLNLHGSVDDEEDLKVLSALSFTESIRMNLDALTRNSADHYAYTADSYVDLNLDYGAKAVKDANETAWINSSYAQLSLAQDGNNANREQRPRHHQRSLERSQDSQDKGSLEASSTRDSPPSESLTSGRSSSDANDDELRTPPEPSYERFEPVDGPTSHERAIPQSSAQRSPIPSHQAPASTPSSNQATPVAAQAPQLGSPFQPSRPQFRQAHLSQYRAEPQEAFSRYQIGNSSEIELLSDDVHAQRHAAGKAKMTSWQNESVASSQSAHSPGHSRCSSSVFAIHESNKPFTRLGPQDIAFSATTIPEQRLTAEDCVNSIVSRYPTLCDAPLREFGEDGQPLPPTKKQETSAEERQARKQALRVQFCAKQRLSLIKAMVVMESRSASWKRIGPFNPSNHNTNSASASVISHQQPSREVSPRSSTEVARLPPMPSPWSMEIHHEQLDVAQIKGKSKKTIELASLRINACCVKCDGSGLGACVTCKAEQADECFWCSGTGREKTRAQAWCRRCQGAGVLKCNTCHGSLKSDCRSCEGTGTGEYGFFVDVIVKRVEMPAVPVSTLFPQFDDSLNFEPTYDKVRAAATLTLWDSILKLTEARSQAVMLKGGKGKSKDMVPVMAACVWENSTTHVVAVDVPLAARFKKGATPALRPEGLHRKIPAQRRFFTVPADADLRSVELSEEEVKKITSPSLHKRNLPRAGGEGSHSAANSPAMSSIEFGPSASPPLAIPEEGAVVSGYSTPTRVPSPRSDVGPAKPAAREFFHHPSPLSQLSAATQSPAPSPSASFVHQNQSEVFDSHALGSKQRRPSAGHILTKKLSSNILNKLGAHRGSL
ncbi:related to conserved hypothetical Ustilaginaceae-specific protein [Ustilago bromivora]|uniref:Related to conserved hypothetical Ustilaginaceae-specific protein n=1 Tax=Ustilago bromivora TaxID=307758 RepID=A0A1K0G8T4_9BASI|nr:related to conserved hypothetical Ustilaginaceae-specific protein [Ustilago bromivora]SYW86119.1 related to conserved hypothetical Ustilaginaceae-specific protein [Ustilago bromivora]